MEFRIEKTVAALLMLMAGAMAQPMHVEVRHQHWHGGAAGALTIGADGVSFEEPGKHREHSRAWKFEDLQQVELSESRIRLLTYEDVRWQLGRDREMVFDALPAGAARQLYPFLREHLDQRFVAAVADRDAPALWQMPAKLLDGRSGSSGTLLVTADRISFETAAAEKSRTWRFTDIQFISSADPFELSLTTYERAAWHHGGPRVVRLQLKQRLSEDRYNRLWRAVNESQSKENQHDQN